MERFYDLTWERHLREARLLLLKPDGRKQVEAYAFLATGTGYPCRCWYCACARVLVDDNEALAGGPSW